MTSQERPDLRNAEGKLTRQKTQIVRVKESFRLNNSLLLLRQFSLLNPFYIYILSFSHLSNNHCITQPVYTLQPLSQPKTLWPGMIVPVCIRFVLSLAPLLTWHSLVSDSVSRCRLETSDIFCLDTGWSVYFLSLVNSEKCHW